MLLRKTSFDLAISCALLASLTPAEAVEYEHIDLSSTSGESLTLTGDHVTHIGKGPSIKVSGATNEFVGSALNITAIAEADNDAVTGVQVLDGARAELNRSTILASGYFGDGAIASGAGSTLRLHDTDIITHGNRGRGVMVDKGATAELHGGTISTSGLIADALSATGNGSIIRSNGSTLISAGTAAYAIRAQNGATIELRDVSAVTYGQSAPVFAVTGGASLIKADGVCALSLKAQGADIDAGIFVFNNGSLKANGDAILIRPSTQTGGQALVSHSKIVSQTGNGINLDAHHALVDLDHVQVTTEGKNGAGIWMPGTNSRAVVRDSQLETRGAQAAGVDNRAGAFLMRGGSVTTYGKSAHGLYASTGVIGNPAETPSASFDVQNGLIETFGEGSVGALARNSGTHMAIAHSRVLTHGDISHALFVSGKGAEFEVTDSSVTTQGLSAYGAQVSNNGVLSLQGSQVDTFGDKAYALVSQATATGVNNHMQLVDSVVRAHNSDALRVSGGSLDMTLSNSTLSGRTGEGTGNAVWVTDGENGVKAGRSTIDSYNSSIAGDIQVDAGTFHIALHDQSTFEGAIRDPGNASNLNVDRSSAWVMHGDSRVASMTNNGTVDFAKPALASFKQLTVSGELAGDGRYLMNTNVGALRGDRLDVDGQVTGNNQILVRNSGGEPTAAGQLLTLVQSHGGSGGFTLANRDGWVDVGTYRYALRRDSGGTGDETRNSRWSLVNLSQVETDPTPATPAPQNLSTAASAAINTSAIATLRDTWDAERSNLIQRMGDVRKDGHDEGVWMRSYGQKQLLENGVGRHFSQHVNGVQLGVDGRVSTARGSLLLGGLIGYSETHRRFDNEGNGTLDSYHIGSYVTYLDNSGWYADGLITLNRWSNRIDVESSDGAQVNGHARSHGAGLALEAGKRINLDDGWFVEPQAQISALYVSADQYQLSNGMRVSAGDAVSTQALAGSRVGRELKLHNAVTLQPYLKLGWSQDLTARNEVRTNDIASHPDGEGGGWYAGAGITGSVGADQHVYAELETSDSSAVKRPWALNIGYRLTW